MRCELYPTMVTPFTAEGKIDEKSLERLLDHFDAQGLDGVFAVCQSSEMFFLSEEEKLRLAEKCISFCRARGMKCVVSGHTQDSLDGQIAYLKALEALKPDAIILVSNRFAKEDEGEDVLITNLKTVLSALSPETRLGMYECPYPYKRALSGEMLDAMIKDGRFRFVKDTCCRIGEIRARLQRLSGSGIELYNANAATLYESLEAGAAGYSGIMLNMMPEVFTLLRSSVAKGGNLARAKKAAELISATSVIEYQNYPANAKRMLKRHGIFETTVVRNGKPPLTESQEKETDDFEKTVMEAYIRLLPRAQAIGAFEPDVFFPECHASCVFPTADGEMVVYFAGTREKADDVGIWLSRKDKTGWKAPKRIAKVLDEAHWNPVIYEIPGGARVCFKVGKEIRDWQSWHTETFDGGETWTKPEPYNAPCGPVRSKPIRLQNGKLLAPNSAETETSWRALVDISEDDGRSFARLAEILLNVSRPNEANFISGLGAIQPALWESAPGKVHALLRTTCGQVFRSDSEDGGAHWSEAYPAGIPNNNSGLDAIFANGSLYAALNPVSGNWAARTPLVILKSTDNGKHFLPFCVVDDLPFDDGRGQSAELSYPSLAYREGKLYVSYTHLRKSVYCAKIPLNQ